MRSSLQPTLFSNDMDFRVQFEKLSNKYASDLILLNLEFLQKELSTLSEKMAQVNQQLKDASTDDEYKQFFDKQTTFLCKFRLELQEVKRKKWQRDQKDYDEGAIYSWNTTNYSKRPRAYKDSDRGETAGRSNEGESFLDRVHPTNHDGNNTGEAASTVTAPGKDKRQKMKAPNTRAASRR